MQHTQVVCSCETDRVQEKIGGNPCFKSLRQSQFGLSHQILHQIQLLKSCTADGLLKRDTPI